MGGMSDKLTAAGEQLLREQTIDEHGPGTILSDFAVLLDYLATHKVAAGGKNQLLPINILPELNALLARSIDVRLKRPVQKSFPHLNGLYLLLRVTGLVRLVAEGKARLLTPNAMLCQTWRAMNLTEQYFTLLEAWLLHGSTEILGERDSQGALSKVMGLFGRLKKGRINVGGSKDWDVNTLRYIPGWHNLALLEMFGWVKITTGKTPAGEGWTIKSITPTAWGLAALELILRSQPDGQALLSQMFAASFLLFDDEPEPSDKAEFNALQPMFQPYFPAWQNILKLEIHQFTAGIYTFKAVLKRYAAWRRITIPGDFVLENLSDVILYAFDFDNDHLHEFTYRNHFGRTVRAGHSYMEEKITSADVRIGEVPLTPGETMNYLFDFGDSWEFDVTLESIAPPDPKVKETHIIETHGKAPGQYPDWDDDEDDE